jgi:membrane fusion protein, copper/silver efflux system
MNAPEGGKPISTARLTWRAIQVRLRFVAVLLAAFVVVGNWESIRNNGEAVARRLFGLSVGTSDQAVSTDTEYFCPMDPGVLSDWPGWCGACNMALVRRKKGEASPRPDGVIARMQFSPYRVQLAGLQTAPVAYRPLEREVTGVGEVVELEGRSVVVATFLIRDRPMIAVGRSALVLSDEGQAVAGRVIARQYAGGPDFSRVRTAPELDSHPTEVGSTGKFPSASALEARGSCLIEVDDPKALPPPGVRLVAKVRVPIAELEPFCSLPSNAPPLRKDEPRGLYACPEHPDALKESPGRCAIDRNVLELQKLAANQRVGWWCPMHPSVIAEGPDATCKSCEGIALVARIVTYRPPGQVLSIPESAVIDTGTRKVAFIERMPGMFDAVEIVVGPRCGGDYPVVSGLSQGDKVATAGALLIDAETRLNPSLAASYFGASARAEPKRVVETCPVTGKALGSMGAPVRVDLEGTTVWICCSGCEAALRKDPAKYLAKSAKRE